MPSTRTNPDRVQATNFDELLVELRAIRRALTDQAAAVLNREAAAAYLGISMATLDRLTSAGKLRSVRVSEGRVGWTRKALDAYLAVLEEQ